MKTHNLPLDHDVGYVKKLVIWKNQREELHHQTGEGRGARVRGGTILFRRIRLK